MVNEEILAALQSALARGESLKKAMMTLYNAGYKKEEISEASRSVNQTPTTQPQTPQQPIQPTKLSLFKKKPIQSAQPVGTQTLSPPQSQQPGAQVPLQQTQPPGSQTPQRVSGYGQPPKPMGKTIIIVLGFLLLILVGILVTIFLFKEELINFFNNVFN